MQHEPAPIASTEHRIGYAAFLAAGVCTLIIAAVGRIPMDSGTAGGMGFLVVLPLFAGSAMSVLVGLVLALKLRDWGLLVLAGASVMFFGDFLLEPGPLWWRRVASAAYGLVAVGIPAWWFVLGPNRRNA